MISRLQRLLGLFGEAISVASSQEDDLKLAKVGWISIVLVIVDQVIL